MVLVCSENIMRIQYAFVYQNFPWNSWLICTAQSITPSIPIDLPLYSSSSILPFLSSHCFRTLGPQGPHSLNSTSPWNPPVPSPPLSPPHPLTAALGSAAWANSQAVWRTTMKKWSSPTTDRYLPRSGRWEERPTSNLIHLCRNHHHFLVLSPVSDLPAATFWLLHFPFLVFCSAPTSGHNKATETAFQV